MPIAIGENAPDFLLRNQNHQEVRLSGFRGRKNVLLVFYPFAFSQVCHGELGQVRDHLGDFVNEDAELMTISCDAPYAQKAWAIQEGYEFQMLSDFWPHGAVSKAYGVFNAEKGFPLRGTFLVDRHGVVRFAEVGPTGQARDQDGWRTALATV